MDSLGLIFGHITIPIAFKLCLRCYRRHLYFWMGLFSPKCFSHVQMEKRRKHGSDLVRPDNHG